MCLSTIYLKHNGHKIEIMLDVAYMEAQKGGFVLAGLLGDRKFIKGEIKIIDFVDDHSVVIEEVITGTNNE